MEPIIAGIIAGVLALAVLAMVGFYIAAAVMLFRIANLIIKDLKGD